jgi:hypothetical protein
VFRRSWPSRRLSVSRLNELYAARSGPAKRTALPGLPVDQHLADGEAQDLFGTLVHHVLNSKISGTYREGRIPESILAGLDPKAIQLFIRTAVSLADGFLASGHGKELAGAAFIEPELPFIHRVMTGNGPVHVHGAVDLAYETNGGLNIIDFKTDAVLSPSRYAFQLWFYAHALGALYGKPARAFLYFLRNGEAHEVTEKVDHESLVSLVEQASGGDGP